MRDVPVVLFNANSVGVQVAVNGGAPVAIHATNTGLRFIPQRAPVNPTFSDQGAAPNVLAPGTNFLSIVPSGTQQPFPFQLHIPPDAQILSLQVYLYWRSDDTVSWVILNNGQVLSTNLSC